MRALRATNYEDLGRLGSELHDSTIDLPLPAEFSEPRSVHMLGTFEFGEVRELRSWGPLVRVEEAKPRIELTVENVTSVRLDDGAEIGVLDISKICYDAMLGEVLIEGNVPVSIALTVTSLEVRVVVTDEIVDRRECWRLRPWRRRPRSARERL